jgi:hypothetical protein
MLKIKWTDKVTNVEVFKRENEERLFLEIFKNICQLWLGHIIRLYKFVVNILEGAIFWKRAVGRP